MHPKSRREATRKAKGRKSVSIMRVSSLKPKLVFVEKNSAELAYGVLTHETQSDSDLF